MNHPPYHLRVNKAVDRLLLVNVIRSLGKEYEEGTYYTLSGPFLEDLRVMDHFFPRMRLVSIEKDKPTHSRQEFHRFSSKTRVILKRISVHSFLNDLYEPTPDTVDIFWLDYTGLEYKNFTEFQRVLKIVPLGSIVRITVRAQPELNFEELEAWLSKEEKERISSQMEAEFQRTFEGVLPEGAPGALASRADYAAMVQGMVQIAASQAVDYNGSDRTVIHVNSIRYNDGTQMLSVTLVVCKRDNEQEQIVRQKLNSLGTSFFDWGEVKWLNIPALSSKECVCLERELPVDPTKDIGQILMDSLGYAITGAPMSSKELLQHYAEYYREYPRFIRMPI
jgi:hypothetical protein